MLTSFETSISPPHPTLGKWSRLCIPNLFSFFVIPLKQGALLSHFASPRAAGCCKETGGGAGEDALVSSRPRWKHCRWDSSALAIFAQQPIKKRYSDIPCCWPCMCRSDGAIVRDIIWRLFSQEGSWEGMKKENDGTMNIVLVANAAAPPCLLSRFRSLKRIGLAKDSSGGAFWRLGTWQEDDAFVREI